MANMFKRYGEFLRQRPLLGNMITSGTLFATGDLLGQVIQHSGQGEDSRAGDRDGPRLRLDWGRCINNGIYGGIVFAPIACKLYGFLQRRVRWPFRLGVLGPNADRARLALDGVARMGVDQLCWSPVGIVLYFSWINLIEGYRSGEMQPQQLRETLVRRVDANFRDTLLANWSVWPLFQVVNFTVVPPAYRLFTVGILSVLWNGFLIIKARNDPQKRAPEVKFANPS